MGVRLIVEVLDHWQDAGLTPGERWDLLVLAENANDGTRLTFGPVHAQHILDRANKSPKGWKNAITALMRKKVITTHVPGRIKQVAVYHLEHLCPEPPHSGHKGLCTKPEKGVDNVDTPAQEEGYPSANPPAQEGHLSDDPVPEEGHPVDDPMGHPVDDPLAQEGHPVDAERVTQQVTPTPPYSSFKDSPLSTPSSSVAEDSSVVGESATTATDGGGGGDSLSLEEITEQTERAEAFVDSLPFHPGKQPGKKQRQQIVTRVVAAFKAGWSENGLRRYLDVSDDPNVRSAAAVYLHRLDGDELPDAPVGVDPQLSPACWDCLGANPAAATDLTLRVNPITCDPCPNCHPATVGQKPEVPPVCDACVRENAAAQFNIRFRYRIIDGQHQACPDCHPKRIVILAAQGAANIQQRLATGDWKGAGTDERALGWLQLSRNLSAEERINVGPQPPGGQRKALNVGRRYDNDVWSRPADPAKASKIPHCGDPNCDPVTRLKTGPDWTGELHTSVCDNCHPASKF